jgi:hypothetical protein
MLQTQHLAVTLTPLDGTAVPLCAAVPRFGNPVIESKLLFNITNRVNLNAFHGFGQAAKLGYVGLVLGSSHFLLIQQQPQKMMLALQVVKSDSEIIVSFC